MRYDPATDHYVPIGWDEAFALVAHELNTLADPRTRAEFYTSGRTSNEALYQLFARRFGTNNFPDCSKMCHEPTSVELPESIGIGKGTVVELCSIDSLRMLLHVEVGKGGRDRYAMLSPRLLGILRFHWKRAQPRLWLFPGQEPGDHVSIERRG